MIDRSEEFTIHQYLKKLFESSDLISLVAVNVDWLCILYVTLKLMFKHITLLVRSFQAIDLLAISAHFQDTCLVSVARFHINQWQ